MNKYSFPPTTSGGKLYITASITWFQAIQIKICIYAKLSATLPNKGTLMTKKQFIERTGDAPSSDIDFSNLDTTGNFTVMIGPEYYTEETARESNLTKSESAEAMGGDCAIGCSRESYNGKYLQSLLPGYKSTHEFTLPAGSYREYKIPKRSGGFRKITAPSPALLKYQRSKLKGLEEYFYAQVAHTPLANVAHGFLRNRNCITGASLHIGYKATIMMDISNFFDTVHHTMIPTELYDASLFHIKGYAAQGFATSPLLANIALLPALGQIHELLDDLFTSFALTIYADDIQISVNDDDHEILNEVINSVYAILEYNGFSANTKKTRIKYTKYGYRRILGVNVGDTEVRATRATMRKIRAARHNSQNKLLEPTERKSAGNSLGGLITWARNLLPKKYKPLT